MQKGKYMKYMATETKKHLRNNPQPPAPLTLLRLKSPPRSSRSSFRYWLCCYLNICRYYHLYYKFWVLEELLKTWNNWTWVVWRWRKGKMSSDLKTERRERLINDSGRLPRQWWVDGALPSSRSLQTWSWSASLPVGGWRLESVSPTHFMAVGEPD